MDDLQERIRRGDIDAFADPALELHLLVEPAAAWWSEGTGRAWAALLYEIRAQVLRSLPYEAYARHVDRITGRLLDEPVQVTARALLSLLPSAPSEWVAALEILERYSPAEPRPPRPSP